MQAHVTVDEHSHTHWLTHTYKQVATTRTPSEKYRFLFIGSSFCPFFPAQSITHDIYSTHAKNVYLRMQVAEKTEFSPSWNRSNMKKQNEHLLKFEIYARNPKSRERRKKNSDWNHTHS